jgi:hypothetical protein
MGYNRDQSKKKSKKSKDQYKKKSGTAKKPKK